MWAGLLGTEELDWGQTGVTGGTQELGQREAVAGLLLAGGVTGNRGAGSQCDRE